MRLPRFTLWRLMLLIAALAILFRGYAEGGRVSHWEYYARGEWKLLAMADQVEMRRGTPREQPLDTALLADIRRLAEEKARYAAQYRPYPIGVACLALTLFGLVALPLILAGRLVGCLRRRLAARVNFR